MLPCHRGGVSMNALSLVPWNGLSIGVGTQGRASGLRKDQAGVDLQDLLLIAP